jgi:hypothetical protein
VNGNPGVIIGQVQELDLLKTNIFPFRPGEAVRQMLAHGRRGLGGHDFGASGRRGGAAAGSGRVHGGKLEYSTVIH